MIIDYTKRRRDALYAELLANGDKYIYQAELYDNLQDYYPQLDGRAFHDSTARVIMSDDISEINRSPEYEHVIISTRRGIKIATREEAREMISKRWTVARRELGDLIKMTNKFDRDALIPVTQIGG